MSRKGKIKSLQEQDEERKAMEEEQRQKEEDERRQKREEEQRLMKEQAAAALTTDLDTGGKRAGTQMFAPLEDRLKLKTFILKNWTSTCSHSAGLLSGRGSTPPKAVHAKYCNGLFIHYKTKEGILHGEFKQTYTTTIEEVLAIIQNLALMLGAAPPARLIPEFEDSVFYPKGYPKPLPELKEPELCTCTFPMTCRKHIKRMPTKDEDQFIPNTIDSNDKPLVVEKLPHEPEYQMIPPFVLPPEIKKTPEFVYERATPLAILDENLLTLALDEPPLMDRRIVAGLVSIRNVGDGTWRIFGELLTSLAKRCSIISIIIDPSEYEHVLDYLENGEGGGINKPKLEKCNLVKEVRNFSGNLETASESCVLKSDMMQARALTAAEIGRSKERRSVLASHCIGIQVDMVAQIQPNAKGSVSAVRKEHGGDGGASKRHQQNERESERSKPNQIVLFPVKLSSGEFQAPAPEIHAPFDERQFSMPPRPTIRPEIPLPRPSDYLPFPFQPHEANLPKSIYELPTGSGSLCRIKPPTWKDPVLEDDEKVVVPDFQYTDMKEKRKDIACLSLVAFYRGSELEFENVEEFKTDVQHRAYHPPQYFEPELVAFEPIPMPDISFDSVRWLPDRDIENLDRFLFEEDLGSHPIFVIDAGGSMTGRRWQALLTHLLDLFSPSGRVERLTESFDLVVTLNNNFYSYSGGLGHRRHLTSTSGYSCESACSWLMQWIPGGNADLFGALSCAFDCLDVNQIHLISHKHPERGPAIRDLVTKKCRGTRNAVVESSGSTSEWRRSDVQFQWPPNKHENNGVHINCLAFDTTRPARRFLQSIAQMTGGQFREYVMHVPSCPLRDLKPSVLGGERGKKQKRGDDEKHRSFWDKVKNAILKRGIVEWISNLDMDAKGIISTKDVVSDVKSLLDDSEALVNEMSKMILTEDVGEDDKVDVRDLLRAVVIEGYTMNSDDHQQSAMRYHSLRPKTRESIIEHSDKLLNYFHEFEDDTSDEELHLVFRELLKALRTFNVDLKLGISEVELLKCSLLVIPDDDGRIDCQDLLSFFAKEPAKRAERVRRQKEERKQATGHLASRECECLKSAEHSDDSLVHFLTPGELKKRIEHIQMQEAEYLAKRLSVETENHQMNQRRREEVDAKNRELLEEAKRDHERRLKEYYDAINEQIEKDREFHFKNRAKGPATRNKSRQQKQFYEILIRCLSEGLKPGGLLPMSIAEMESLYADPRSLVEEREQRENRESRRKAHAEALQRMGGIRTVPNTVKFNTDSLKKALEVEEGIGRTGLLHDIRTCPCCSLARPLYLDTEVEAQEWHKIDIKLTFPHFHEEMMIPQISNSVKRALAAEFVQGDYFVKATDIDFGEMKDLRPTVLETHRGMRVKLQVQVQIYMHSGVDQCRKGFDRLDTFLRTGEMNSKLQQQGFPIKLLKKELVAYEKPKMAHVNADLAQATIAKDFIAEHEAAWKEYTTALESEDARQLAADKDALEIHKRLCMAAERENARRLKKKKSQQLKVHNHELREINDKNLARLKKYRQLLKKENDKLNNEEQAKYEVKKVAAEQRFNHEFDIAQENNRLAKLDEEAAATYDANRMKEQSRLAMAKRDAYKQWLDQDQDIRRRNQLKFDVEVQAYEELEGIWVKKFNETTKMTREVFLELEAYLERLHEEQMRKAHGLHLHFFGNQEKSNAMLTEAAEALHAKTVRDIEEANHAKKVKWEAECSEVTQRNLKREEEWVKAQIEVRNHNEAEIERCLNLFETQVAVCNKFNAQLRESLNREALQKREETTRDNKITLQLAREKYECHYKKDMGHNEKIELMLQQTAEIREQLVACRRFVNVIKHRFSEEVKREGLSFADPEGFEHKFIASAVPELMKMTAAKIFSSWWHESGPTEQLVVFKRIDPTIEKQLEQANNSIRTTYEQFSTTKESDPLSLPHTPATTANGLHQKTLEKGPNSSRRRPSSPSVSDENPGEKVVEISVESGWDAAVKRWCKPKLRRLPLENDIFLQMFEANMVHKPYAPPKGSPLEQKPKITPRAKNIKKVPEAPKKPAHLMTWDERVAELERQRKLKERPPPPPKPPTPPPKDPGDDWTAMDDLYMHENTSRQPWKYRASLSTRPQTARAFGSSTPRHFLWNLAAGSKLLPGGTVGTPQGLELLRQANHLERMQIEREERQRRLALQRVFREKEEKKAAQERSAQIARGELQPPVPPPTTTGAEVGQKLIPTWVFVEALHAAFAHLGVEFQSKKAAGTRIAEDSSFIPMLPASFEPNRHVPDDGHLTPCDGRRLVLPKEIAYLPRFGDTDRYRSNKLAFIGAHGRWEPAPKEPSRQEQARWKTQFYP